MQGDPGREILRVPHSQGGAMLRRMAALSAPILLIAALAGGSPAGGSPRHSAPGADVRLTNDDPALSGYVSAYTLATGQAYTDPVLDECSIARGRQNEPAGEVDPRNSNVLIGSAKDYRGVYFTELTITLSRIAIAYFHSV